MDAIPDSREISARIKQIISRVTGLDPTRIDDQASLREDLSLDSLSLLEIAVESDLEFSLELPDETYRGIDTLPRMVGLVEERLRELASRAEAVSR